VDFLPRKIFHCEKLTDRSANSLSYLSKKVSKDKTPKRLIEKLDERISLPVASVAALETDRGIGN
jgi:hypothetical protein